MYEISLVPDVKGELLKKQKLRNLIILICFAVGAACIAVLTVLFGISSGQKIKISNTEKEIECRYQGTGDCGKYGTAILNFENSEDFLTIQKQMEDVGTLNDEKVKLSRIFGVLDVILPNDEEDQVTLSELNVDLLGWSIYFNASAWSNNQIHFRAVENFQKGLALSYYDYGSYMREGGDDDEKDENGFTVIPSFCIDEYTVEDYVFGVYHKGMPYCEDNVLVDNRPKDEKGKDDKKSEDDESEEENNAVDVDAILEETTANLKPNEYIYQDNDVYYKVENIWIRRSFKKESDIREYYLNGKDEKVQDILAKKYSTKESTPYGGISETKKGYYFQSACLQYNNGEVDETATHDVCPVLASDLVMGSQGAGRDSDGVLRMSFEANVPLSREIFLAKNTHMQVKNSTRQNVTDSYIQVRDMFSEELIPEGEVK